MVESVVPQDVEGQAFTTSKEELPCVVVPVGGRVLPEAEGTGVFTTEFSRHALSCGQVTFVSTRKAQIIADELAPQLVLGPSLHSLMRRMTPACSEILTQHVLVELPSLGAEDFHVQLLKFVQTLISANKIVCLLVQPNL